MKVLSCNFGAILLKKPKNVRDSAPLIIYENTVIEVIKYTWYTQLLKTTQERTP